MTNPLFLENFSSVFIYITRYARSTTRTLVTKHRLLNDCVTLRSDDVQGVDVKSETNDYKRPEKDFFFNANQMFLLIILINKP